MKLEAGKAVKEEDEDEDNEQDETQEKQKKEVRRVININIESDFVYYDNQILIMIRLTHMQST